MLSGEAKRAQYSAQQQQDHEWRQARERLTGIKAKTRQAICPTCGGMIENCAPLSSLKSIRLSKSRSIIRDLLVEAYPRSVSRDFIVDTIYGDRNDGAPDTAQGCVYTMTHHINIKLQPLGWKISAVRTYDNCIVLHPLHMQR